MILPDKNSDKIMLFDLKSTGHHANYICHLIRYWGICRPSARLTVLVTPTFLEKHSDVAFLSEKYNVELLSISLKEEETIQCKGKLFGRLVQNLREWHLLCQYANLLKIDHCLIMYLDTCEVPLLLKLKPPCLISGIYFRPTFHYKYLTNYRPTQGEFLRRVRDRFFLYQALTNSKLHTLFCLDPLAGQIIKKLYPSARVIPLADPVEIPNFSSSDVDNLRERYEISQNRKIFLLFGNINERKGIYKLLEAFEELPYKSCQKICLLVVGEIGSSEKSAVSLKTRMLCQGKPLQIIFNFGFVSESEIKNYFQVADVILALYQEHVGMSGILLLAAAFQKPVLSTDYGLMGELVKRYQLGLTVDSTCVKEIVDGLTESLKPNGFSFSTKQMKEFAEMNTADKFSKTIFENISYG